MANFGNFGFGNFFGNFFGNTIPLPPDFGDVRSDGNVNPNIEGQNNTGSVLNNTNIKLSCRNSTLNLRNTTNVNYNIDNSEVDSSNGTNENMNGRRNEATLDSNTNSKFQGTDNVWTARNNTNLKAYGNNSRLTLRNNTNASITGNGNRVRATNTTNLTVTGDNNRIRVSDVRNHHLRLAPAGNDNEAPTNQLEIIFGNGNSRNNIHVNFTNGVSLKGISSSGNGCFSGTGSLTGRGDSFCVRTGVIVQISNNNNARFIVDYADEATIENQNYRIGIFEFEVEKASESEYKIIVDVSELEQENREKIITGSSEVKISATKNGKRESLNFVAASITQAEENWAFTVRLPNS